MSDRGKGSETRRSMETRSDRIVACAPPWHKSMSLLKLESITAKDGDYHDKYLFEFVIRLKQSMAYHGLDSRADIAEV